MIQQLASWWRARTAREQLLVRACVVLLFVILAPLLAYQAAASYRSDAARELTVAREVQADVARLAESGASAAAAGDATLRGRALAAAESAGLTVARVEPLQQDRLRISFAPAHSLRVYRWIDLMGRSGAFISRTALVRVEGGEELTAEFEVAAGP